MPDEKTLQLSELTRRRLEGAYAAQQGAVAVANAAANVANQLVGAYQQLLTSWLEDQGVDVGAVNASVDLKSGIVTLGPRDHTGGTP